MVSDEKMFENVDGWMMDKGVINWDTICSSMSLGSGELKIGEECSRSKLPYDS